MPGEAITLDQNRGRDGDRAIFVFDDLMIGQTAALRELQAAGVPIKTNHHSGLMHLKMAVRSDAVALGSFNWTNNAEMLNDEVFGIFTDSEQVARAAWVFDSMWGDASRFVPWHPPTAAELGAMLTRQMPEF